MSGTMTTIRETSAEESSSISGVLRYCKSKILCPYLKLLGVMGLKPINSDSHEMCTFSLFLNKFYIVVVAAVLISGYSLQYLTCFRRDRGFLYNENALHIRGTLIPGFKNFHHGNNLANITTDLNFPNLNHNNSSQPSGIVKLPCNDSKGSISRRTEDGGIIAMRLHADHNSSSSGTDMFGMRPICVGNPIYVHVIPGVLHLTSFFIMVHLYWFNDDEQLQNLMERVFIQAAQAHVNCFSKKKLVRTLQAMVSISVSWVILSIAFQMVLILDHGIHFIHTNTWNSIGDMWMYVIVSFLVFTTFWQDAIHVTIITSYSIHCLLLSSYLDLIHSRIQHHSIILSECIKEIGELNKLLAYLNTELANGIGPLLILNLTFAVSTITYLRTNLLKLALVDLLCTSMFALLWIILIFFLLFQACKLSSSCKNVRKFGHMVRMRPFGYQDVPQADLDSFLLFVSTLKMQVRICKLPISSTSVACSLCGYSLFMLLWGHFAY